MIDLKHGDCLELMKDIPDNSIDLIVIDPPYNIKKAEWDTWKTIADYIVFMGEVFKECERVLKGNGSFYFFHNDFIQIVELQNWLNKNSVFVFNSMIHWNKPNFRALSWKNPSEKNNLRSWFNCVEYCLFYTFQDDRGYNDLTMFSSIRDYFKQEREKIKHLSIKDINKRLGFKLNGGSFASDVLSSYKLNWKFPLKHIYNKFKELGICLREYEDLRKEYEDLRKEYEDLRYTHNLDKNHNNIWHSKETNSGKNHPTQKPIDIMERIVETSSNKNDIVLDCFMGSGSTGIACKNLNRSFIGIEKDENYFNIAKKRINEIDTK